MSGEMKDFGRALQQRPHCIILLAHNSIVSGRNDVASFVEEEPVEETLLAHVLRWGMAVAGEHLLVRLD